MAFTRSPEKPDSSLWLRDLSDLGRMSQDQFDEEIAFWKSVKGVGGFFQIELGETVLEKVLAPVGALIELQVPWEVSRVKNFGSNTARWLLAGLALSHLVRKVYGFDGLERGIVGPGAPVGGIDFDVHGLQPVTFLHEKIERVTGFIPEYDPSAQGAWYEDETLILRAFHPAKATTAFTDKMQAVLGEPFDPSHHVTLRPHLKLDYIQG